jgi:hypothetical protein
VSFSRVIPCAAMVSNLLCKVFHQRQCCVCACPCCCRVLCCAPAPAATSGLDSYTSNEVMTVVKGLTKDGTTVAATIHSPSSTCYSLFDKVSKTRVVQVLVGVCATFSCTPGCPVV